MHKHDNEDTYKHQAVNAAAPPPEVGAAAAVAAVTEPAWDVVQKNWGDAATKLSTAFPNLSTTDITNAKEGTRDELVLVISRMEKIPHTEANMRLAQVLSTVTTTTTEPTP